MGDSLQKRIHACVQSYFNRGDWHPLPPHEYPLTSLLLCGSGDGRGSDYAARRLAETTAGFKEVCAWPIRQMAIR